MTKSNAVGAIEKLQFPFDLKDDQKEAVRAWLNNDCRGSVIFSTGTGKTEIAFECARMASISSSAEAFNILFLVPRIVLIQQNVRRLKQYNIDPKNIGVYYGEKKEPSEITISTYQSIINNFDLIRSSDMVILDEVHLISESAVEFDRIFDVIVEDTKKAILGLTATIDEKDPKFGTIMTVVPPVKRYMIKDAVSDGRLARPEIIPIKVRFSQQEQQIYDDATDKIKQISARLQAYDPVKMTGILRRGGVRASQAKAWFANVRKRKELLSCTNQKLEQAVQVIKLHPNERIMLFSETIYSLKRLEEMLQSHKIPARSIHNGIKKKERTQILESWGDDFFPLLSVHTLEIGYDVPQVGIAIIIASTSNVNQVAQRIGRVIRKSNNKERALIYIIYVDDTKDDKILKIVRTAIERKGTEDKVQSAVPKKMASKQSILEKYINENSK